MMDQTQPTFLCANMLCKLASVESGLHLLAWTVPGMSNELARWYKTRDARAGPGVPFWTEFGLLAQRVRVADTQLKSCRVSKPCVEWQCEFSA